MHYLGEQLFSKWWKTLMLLVQLTTETPDKSASASKLSFSSSDENILIAFSCYCRKLLWKKTVRYLHLLVDIIRQVKNGFQFLAYFCSTIFSSLFFFLLFSFQYYFSIGNLKRSIRVIITDLSLSLCVFFYLIFQWDF